MSNAHHNLNDYYKELYVILDCFCNKTKDAIICSLKDAMREHIDDERHRQLAVLFYVATVSLHHAYNRKNTEDPLKGQPLPIDIKEQLEKILQKEKTKAAINITFLTIYVLALTGLLIYATKDVIIDVLDTILNRDTIKAAGTYLPDFPIQNKIINTLFSDKGLIILAVTIVGILSLPGIYKRFKENLEMMKHVKQNMSERKFRLSLQEIKQLCEIRH